MVQRLASVIFSSLQKHAHENDLERVSIKKIPPVYPFPVYCFCSGIFRHFFYDKT